MNIINCMFTNTGDKQGVDLAKLTVIAALLTLLGDFFAFLIAVYELQQEKAGSD
ncbi:MAG: hypothetical protein GX541_01645 [Clostridiales bacterium]|nr:hypothetical protein [Clostridiales bacterium]